MGGQYIEAMPWPFRRDGPAPQPPGAALAAASGRAGASLVWPCQVCASWDGQGLCAACRSRFAPARLQACPRCALHCPGGRVCGNCLRQPPPYAGCTAAVDYGFPWDRLVARLKFQAQPELAGLLAELMHRALLDAAPPVATVQAVLPVPLSPARLAERGYNQAWELARRLARRLRLPAQADSLLRLHDTPHQVGLSRAARERNLSGSLWVDGRAGRVDGLHLALVDDVLTTGSTASAATRALLAAGAASVQVWVLARTPAPGEGPGTAA